jgi:hypothetical protein
MINISTSLFFSTVLSILFCIPGNATDVWEQREQGHFTQTHFDMCALKMPATPINNTNFSEEIWADIGSAGPSLEEIRASLLQQPTVTHLSLSELSLSDEALDMLGGFPNIQYLFLNENCFTDEGAKHLSRLPNIHEIDLSRNYITSKGLAYLNLDELEVLRINFLTLNNDNNIFLKKLSAARKLKELYVAGSDLDAASLEILGDLPLLGVIDISYNTVSSIDLENFIEKMNRKNVTVIADYMHH